MIINEKRILGKLKQYFNECPKTIELFSSHIDDFFEAEEKYKINNKYNMGDEVFLKKGTFMHGTRGNINSLDLILENGFISTEFYGSRQGYEKKPKNPYCVNMWNIQEDMLLKNYIKFYSNAVITFVDLDFKSSYVVLKYGESIDDVIKESKNKSVWKWDIEQTKEIRFMPSLSRDENQLALIINTDNEYARKLIKNDIFDLNFDRDILKTFIGEWFINDFILNKRTPLTTDRESAIIFGLPTSLIEGILVGRKYEKDENILKEIKTKLPNCYICNLDGIVIK